MILLSFYYNNNIGRYYLRNRNVLVRKICIIIVIKYTSVIVIVSAGLNIPTYVLYKYRAIFIFFVHSDRIIIFLTKYPPDDKRTRSR